MKQPPEGWTSRCIVTNVVDGDTLDVELRRTVRIRLDECWSPETRTRDKQEKVKGLAAKEFVQKLVDNSGEATVFIPADREGDLKDILTLDRFLGRIFLDGVDVSPTMVKAGHAKKKKPKKKKG